MTTPAPELQKQLEVQNTLIENLRQTILRLESERDSALTEAKELYAQLYPLSSPLFPGIK